MINTRELKAARIRNDYTQKSLAEKLSMGETSYLKRENGIQPFNLNEAEALTQLLNLTQEEVMKIFFKDYVALNSTNTA